MDNTTPDKLASKIKELEESTMAFANSAQEKVNEKQQEIQQKTLELQNLIKGFQKEIDRREGAIDQLKELVYSPLEVVKDASVEPDKVNE